MPNLHKAHLLEELRQRFGALHKLPDSQSLFMIGEDSARIYYRYSKLHDSGRTFFGLRAIDLRQLEGHNSFLCFHLNDDSEPVFIPYADFEEVFHGSEPAGDGQYKVQLISREQTRELYIARCGRFNIEGFVGFELLERSLDHHRLRTHRDLSHCQVQTLLAAIGHCKGYDVWIPDNNIAQLDWSLTKRFSVARALPNGYEDVAGTLAEIDVVWSAAGSNQIEAVFEVEHSTPIYSGLLRFNDLLLAASGVSRFSIVSNDTRRALFSRQVYRPTFRRSGLAEMVSFLEYVNVLDWHDRIVGIRNADNA